MFCNGVECISGVLAVHDVVKNPELQSRKFYSGLPSSEPDSSEIQEHITEVLRLITHAQIPESGWLGVIHGVVV